MSVKFQSSTESGILPPPWQHLGSCMTATFCCSTGYDHPAWGAVTYELPEGLLKHCIHLQCWCKLQSKPEITCLPTTSADYSLKQAAHCGVCSAVHQSFAQHATRGSDTITIIIAKAQDNKEHLRPGSHTEIVSCNTQWHDNKISRPLLILLTMRWWQHWW